jgi:hypothetical protein
MHDRDGAKPLDPEQAKPPADVLDQLTEVRDPADAAEEGDLESIPLDLTAEADPADVLDQHLIVPCPREDDG